MPSCTTVRDGLIPANTGEAEFVGVDARRLAAAQVEVSLVVVVVQRHHATVRGGAAAAQVEQWK